MKQVYRFLLSLLALILFLSTETATPLAHASYHTPAQTSPTQMTQPPPLSAETKQVQTTQPLPSPIPQGAIILADNPLVVMEQNGRIWMPNRDPENGYTVTFIIPDNMPALPLCFWGINATLLEAGQVLASQINRATVTSVPGATYTVEGGQRNGGFSWEAPNTSVCE